MGRRRRLPVIASGTAANTASQVLTVAANALLTPFLLLHLGSSGYGLFALVSSFRGLLSNLDGGLGTMSARYFAEFVGTGDRRSIGRLLFTVALLLLCTTVALSAIVFLMAPHLVGVLRTNKNLRASGVDLVRELMPLLVISTYRLLGQRIFAAEHRWRYLNITTTCGALVYAVVAALCVGEGLGLRGLVFAAYAQESILTVVTAYGLRRHVSLGDLRLLDRSLIREVIGYSARVQVAAVASSFNYEIDSLIVGIVFPVRFVAFYAIGSNFSTQLMTLPANASQPVAVSLAQTYGRDGKVAVLREFTQIQRLWVRVFAAFPVVGAVGALFAIPRWLGQGDQIAGAIAAILIVGQTGMVLADVMNNLGKVMKLPGLESRFLLMGTAVNVAVTIPLALSIGVLGVPIGTAFGQVVSVVYFLRLAKRSIDPNIRSFLSEIPVFAVVTSAAVCIAVELVVSRYTGHGALGLLECGALAGTALIGYFVTIGRPLIADWKRRDEPEPMVGTH